MLSYCVSLLSMASYAVTDFIRNSSPTWILVTLGSLFFVLGTFLRRHLPGEKEAASSHGATIRERPMSPKTYANAFKDIATTYSATGQNQHLTWVRHTGMSIAVNTHPKPHDVASTPMLRRPVNMDEIAFAQLDHPYVAPRLTK
jgi:hypothetical protein